VVAGDIAIGLESSGLHSNGYSLARRALLEGREAMSLTDSVGAVGPLGEALLRPTRIYVAASAIAMDQGVHAMCHITGGGLPENLPRVLPRGLGIRIDPASWQPSPVFELIQRHGGITDDEMRRTFNMGVGFVMIAGQDQVSDLISALGGIGERAFVLGKVVEGRGVAFGP
jgi:phosphoribosylformylglycinamidine cyclo-ligase